MDADELRRSMMLEHHLYHNHFPPVQRELHPYIVRAIEMGPCQDFVTIEVGAELHTLEQDGMPVTAAELIAQFHLDIFIDDHEEDHADL